MLLRRKIKYAVSLEWLMDTAPQTGAHSDYSQSVERNDTMEQLLKLMAQLDPLSRHILTLREINELSYEEIAESTGHPLGTIKSRISRAKTKLQSLSNPQKIQRGDD